MLSTRPSPGAEKVADNVDPDHFCMRERANTIRNTHTRVSLHPRRPSPSSPPSRREEPREISRKTRKKFSQEEIFHARLFMAIPAIRDVCVTEQRFNFHAHTHTHTRPRTFLCLLNLFTLSVLITLYFYLIPTISIFVIIYS